MLAKTGIAAALHWSRADRLLSAAAGWQSAPPIITYHRVVPDFANSARDTAPPMLVSCDMLEAHLDWIARRFRVVSLDEMGLHLESGTAFERPVAAITFDDGYRDVYEHAFPLFMRKGIPAAVFVVTDLIGTSGIQLHDKLYLMVTRALSTCASARHNFGQFVAGLGVELPELEQLSGVVRDPAALTQTLLDHLPQATVNRVSAALEAEIGSGGGEIPRGLLSMSWEMLAEMHRAGWTIGSHTRSHPRMTKESPEKVVEETSGSRGELQRALGIEVAHFAYPAGRFDSDVVNAVAASGYRFAYTTCAHRDRAHPLLTIPRRVLWQNSGQSAFAPFSSTMMNFQVGAALDFRERCREKHVRPRSLPLAS
jgi:peptidoglycan/xylan/chitin deacetylase (PgdA/CDA1 family)